MPLSANKRKTPSFTIFIQQEIPQKRMAQSCQPGHKFNLFSVPPSLVQGLVLGPAPFQLNPQGTECPSQTFFSREENLSESPQAFLPFQRPELDHMLMFKPINWQEWNLHDSWQLGLQPTFPKIQGHADKSGFLRKKVEVLLERRVMKGCRGKQPIGCATIIKKIFSFFRTLYLALIGNTKKHNLILNQQHTHILTF